MPDEAQLLLLIAVFIQQVSMGFFGKKRPINAFSAGFILMCIILKLGEFL